MRKATENLYQLGLNMTCDHFGMRLLLVLLGQTCCEIETSCNVKLATTGGKIGGRSGVDIGLSSPFCVGFDVEM